MANTSERLVAFELEEDSAELGPDGTVPVAGKDRLALPDISLEAHLSKPGQYTLAATHDGTQTGFFRATIDAEDQACSGISAMASVWRPALEDDAMDHSLAEIWVVNSNATPNQSVEAGWTVSRRQYGDTRPHLFTWYTTNGWVPEQEDWTGCYDTDFSGWVQIDRLIYPGALIPAEGQIGNYRPVLPIEFRLWNGDWWLRVNGRWIGYYPGGLFDSANDNTLRSGANRVLAGGEVYSSRPEPATTTTQMGSGTHPGDNPDPRVVAYWRNVEVANGTEPAIAAIAGVPNVDDQPLFGLCSLNDASFGPVYFFGGPQPLPAT
jgi:hypothetical protein